MSETPCFRPLVSLSICVCPCPKEEEYSHCSKNTEKGIHQEAFRCLSLYHLQQADSGGVSVPCMCMCLKLDRRRDHQVAPSQILELCKQYDLGLLYIGCNL